MANSTGTAKDRPPETPEHVKQRPALGVQICKVTFAFAWYFIEIKVSLKTLRIGSE